MGDMGDMGVRLPIKRRFVGEGLAGRLHYACSTEMGVPASASTAANACSMTCAPLLWYEAWSACHVADSGKLHGLGVYLLYTSFAIHVCSRSRRGSARRKFLYILSTVFAMLSRASMVLPIYPVGIKKGAKLCFLE